MSRPPIDERAVPFPYGRIRQPPTLSSLEEQVRELTKKILWMRMEMEELKQKNRSLETQLKKFYPRS